MVTQTPVEKGNLGHSTGKALEQGSGRQGSGMAGCEERRSITATEISTSRCSWELPGMTPGTEGMDVGTPTNLTPHRKRWVSRKPRCSLGFATTVGHCRRGQLPRPPDARQSKNPALPTPPDTGTFDGCGTYGNPQAGWVKFPVAISFINGCLSSGPSCDLPRASGLPLGARSSPSVLQRSPSRRVGLAESPTPVSPGLEPKCSFGVLLGGIPGAGDRVPTLTHPTVCPPRALARSRDPAHAGALPLAHARCCPCSIIAHPGDARLRFRRLSR